MQADFTSLSAKDPQQKKVLDAVRSLPQQRPARLLQVDLPIETTVNTLLGMGGVTFDPASYWDTALEKGTSDDGTAEAFLWGPTGARRKSHLHLFLTCGPKKKGVDDYDHPITIVGYHMTTSHSVHLVLRDGDVVGTSPKDRAPGPGSSDAAEVTEMTLVCDLLNRARTDEEEEISTTPATPAAEVKPWQVKAAAARELDVHVETLAKMLGVRVPVMQYFLSTIAGLEPEDVEALASGRSRLRTAGFEPEESLLPALDQTAMAAGISTDDVIGLLDLADYPSEPEEIVLFYKGLIATIGT